MFFYESHMGRIFSTNEELSFDELYCEECGDSDSFIGEASTFEEAKELLAPYTSFMDDELLLGENFDMSPCKGCSHNKGLSNEEFEGRIRDFDYCDENCENCINDGCYSIPYIASVLYDSFVSEEKNVFVLVTKSSKDESQVLVNYKPSGRDFGEAFSIPMAYTFDERYVVCLNPLIFFFDDYKLNSLKFINKVKVGNANYIIYEGEADDNLEGASYWEDACDNFGWYGFANFNEIKDKFIIDKKIVDEISKLF